MIELPEPRILCPYCGGTYLEHERIEGFLSDDAEGYVRCPSCHWEGMATYTVDVELFDRHTKKPVPMTPKMREHWRDKATAHVKGINVPRFPRL